MKNQNTNQPAKILKYVGGSFLVWYAFITFTINDIATEEGISLFVSIVGNAFVGFSAMIIFIFLIFLLELTLKEKKKDEIV